MKLLRLKMIVGRKLSLTKVGAAATLGIFNASFLDHGIRGSKCRSQEGGEGDKGNGELHFEVLYNLMLDDGW